MAWSNKVLVCLFYNVLGGFHPWSFVYTPSILSGTLLFLASQRVQMLFKITTIQCTIEAVLRQRNNVFTRTIADSRALQTFIFMSCSAIILHAKRNGAHRAFWLYTPPTSAQQHNNDNTSDAADLATEIPKEHNGVKDVLLSMRNYIAIGLALDIIKMLMGFKSNSVEANTPNTGNRNILLATMSILRLNSTALLTSYIGIYKLIEHYSKQWRLPQWINNEWLAGFFAGTSYIFLPKLTLLTYGITQAFRIFWHYYELRPIQPVDENKKHIRLRKILYKLERVFKCNRISYAAIIYIFSLPYLVHSTFMARPYVGKIVTKIISDVCKCMNIRNVTTKVIATERLMQANAAKVL